MTTALPADLTAIDGGWCVKVLPHGSACVDVLKMLFNYRVVISPRMAGRSEHPESYSRGYCYFGHGHDGEGQQRSMPGAFLSALAAARVWDGVGDPQGFDKRAGSQ